MSEFWASFDRAGQVLTLCTVVTFFPMLTNAGTAAGLAGPAYLAVTAKATSTAHPAVAAPLVVLAEAGSAAGLALFACLAVSAKATSTAHPAAAALLTVLTNAGTVAGLAGPAYLAMKAEATSTTCSALATPLAVRALLKDTLHWVRHRRGWHRCRG
jgi:hypothetical protein